MPIPLSSKRNKIKVASSQAGSPVVPKTFQPMPSHEQIRRRAYEIYQAGGCADGRDQQDWFRAEQEMFRIQQ